MATTNQIRDRIKRRLTRTSDTAIDAIIIDEMTQAQEDLENEALLPNFLVTSVTPAAQTTETFALAGLTGFLRFETNTGAAILVNNGNVDEALQPVVRFDDFELLKQRHPGFLQAGGFVVGYFVSGNSDVLFRPKPTVGVPQMLTYRYYRRDPTLPATGNSTLWTINISGLLMAQAGFNVAEFIRDSQALEYFEALLRRERMKFVKRTQSELDADQEYVMGDD